MGGDRREENDARPGEGHESRMDGLIEPFFSESTLWPVLAVLVLSLVTMGAAILVNALRRRNLFAVAALAVLAAMSADIVWSDVKRRRLGRASALIVALWLLSAGLAAAAAWLGVL